MSNQVAYTLKWSDTHSRQASAIFQRLALWSVRMRPIGIESGAACAPGPPRLRARRDEAPRDGDRIQSSRSAYAAYQSLAAADGPVDLAHGAESLHLTDGEGVVAAAFLRGLVPPGGLQHTERAASLKALQDAGCKLSSGTALETYQAMRPAVEIEKDGFKLAKLSPRQLDSPTLGASLAGTSVLSGEATAELETRLNRLLQPPPPDATVEVRDEDLVSNEIRVPRRAGDSAWSAAA